MPKRVVVILGHPDRNSFCGAIAQQYTVSATKAGHEVRSFALGEIDFDPVLHRGYKQVQPLERGLLEVSEAITWAEHLVFVYPIWWGSVPALLKGLFDRIFVPGYSHKMRKGSALWDRLLAGRSAHLLVTMDTPSWYYRFVYGSPGHRQMKRTILDFSGIRPVRITEFTPLRFSTPAQRERWLQKVDRLAQ